MRQMEGGLLERMPLGEGVDPAPVAGRLLLVAEIETGKSNIGKRGGRKMDDDWLVAADRSVGGMREVFKTRRENLQPFMETGEEAIVSELGYECEGKT